MKGAQHFVADAAAFDLSNEEFSKTSAPSERRSSLLWKAGNSAFYYLSRLIYVLDGAAFSAKTKYLQDNFAPLPFDAELFTEDLKVVKGQLPADLKGAFVRNGPNPYFDPLGRYHWFDGDGMSHGVRLKSSDQGITATYCNRFIETSKLRQEKAAGNPLTAKFGDLSGFSGIVHILVDLVRKKLGIIDTSNGLGTGNTALAFHAGRLLALHEGDAPYWLKLACDGLISTLSRFTFDGRLKHAFTAHPKIDPETAEMFAFGYSVEHAPYCWLYQCSPTGELVSTVEVPIPEPVMMHDFALTQRHVIFIDAPLLFRPEAMIKKKTLPFVYDKQRPTRFGVLDRYAKDSSSIKWFEIDPCMIFHVANAWERSETCLELYVCTFTDFTLDEFQSVAPDSLPYLTRVVLDLESGAATCQRLSPLPGDFPVVPPSRVGRPTKYAYVAAMETSKLGMPLFVGVLKIDLTASGPDSALAGMIQYGDGRFGGEAVFVPRQGATENEEEDDGYLVTYVYDESTNKSDFVVYCAKTMSSVPLAVVELPQRVPFGFHGLWVTEEQIKKQK